MSHGSGGTVTWSFSAFIESFNVTAKVKDKLTGTMTLKLNGDPTNP